MAKEKFLSSLQITEEVLSDFMFKTPLQKEIILKI